MNLLIKIVALGVFGFVVAYKITDSELWGFSVGILAAFVPFMIAVEKMLINVNKDNFDEEK